jgi:hypothetical protein
MGEDVFIPVASTTNTTNNNNNNNTISLNQTEQIPDPGCRRTGFDPNVRFYQKPAIPPRYFQTFFIDLENGSRPLAPSVSYPNGSLTVFFKQGTCPPNKQSPITKTCQADDIVNSMYVDNTFELYRQGPLTTLLIAAPFMATVMIAVFELRKWVMQYIVDKKVEKIKGDLEDSEGRHGIIILDETGRRVRGVSGLNIPRLGEEAVVTISGGSSEGEGDDAGGAGEVRTELEGLAPPTYSLSRYHSTTPTPVPSAPSVHRGDASGTVEASSTSHLESSLTVQQSGRSTSNDGGEEDSNERPR